MQRRSNDSKIFVTGWRICGGIFDLAAKEQQVTELEHRIAEPGFWDNNDEAQKVINTCNQLKEWTTPCQNLKRRAEDVTSLLPEAHELDDPSLITELQDALDAVEVDLEELELRRMLSGELDNKNCYLTINSGAGGTEACDWAQMLARMYQRWATRRQWQCDTVDFVPGEVVGYKHITLKFTGPFAFGYCKAEKGVHRLVRISPFDSNARRHTSFASVEITPEITEDIQVDVRPDELRVDTYRASGAGGQHVNKTDSAVRMTHLPTGIVVSCQGERSQIQNRETCLKMLRSRLYELKVEEREAQAKELAGEKKAIGWGSQIRNYVFQPYTLVKDARTKVESGNIQAVMDGDLDLFVHAYLKELGSSHGRE